MMLGVAMALLAFLGVFLIGGNLAGGVAARSQEVSILAANRDIQPREAITSDTFAKVRYPALQVPPGAILEASMVAGRIAQVTILKGQPITTNLVTTSTDQINNATSAFLPIPVGYVALTIPTGEQQGVAGYVAPGDHINVIATVDVHGLFPSGDSDRQTKIVTKTVYSDLRIIRVGPPASPSKDGVQQGLSSSLTVVVTECDAEYLNWLISNTTLKYSLESYHDYGPALSGPNPACVSPTGTGGISASQVDAKFGFTKLAA